MSSNDIAIKVENISKLYRIGLKQETNVAAVIPGAKVIQRHDSVIIFDISEVGYSSRWGIVAPLLDWKIKNKNG